MSGLSRIIAAFDEESSVLSNNQLVPRNSPFYSPYLVQNLKKVRAIRDLYKTVEVDRRKKLFLNFALRAATLAVLDETRKHKNAVTVMITFQLDPEYCNHLRDVDSASSSEPPMTRLREVLKRKIFSKFGILHSYFVVERSPTSGGFHVHAVCSIKCPELKSIKNVDFENTDTCMKLKQTIRAMREVSKSHTALQIKTEYQREVYSTVIGQERVELLQLEIDTLGAKSGWCEGKTFKDMATGEETVLSYKTVGQHPLDTGIADYLAKNLNDGLFNRSRYNFSISTATRRDLKKLAQQVIKSNRGA